MQDLQVGNTVRLKSGGPPMTVKELVATHVHSPPDAPRDHVMCQWFDETGKCRTARFPVASLDGE